MLSISIRPTTNVMINQPKCLFNPEKFYFFMNVFNIRSNRAKNCWLLVPKLLYLYIWYMHNIRDKRPISYFWYHLRTIWLSAWESSLWKKQTHIFCHLWSSLLLTKIWRQARKDIGGEKEGVKCNVENKTVQWVCLQTCHYIWILSQLTPDHQFGIGKINLVSGIPM